MANDDRTAAPSHDDATTASQPANDHIATVPNLLSGIRFAGSFVIVGLALWGNMAWLLPTYVALMFTDWFDGRIAVRFHQQTTFGARLDSLADVSFYSAALLAMAWLRTDLVSAELHWLWPGIAVYAVNCVAGLIRFGHLPAYHTRGAKIGWLLATLAIFGVLAAGMGWPLRAAGAWVLLINAEALLITFVLPHGAVDVPSLYHAIRLRQHAAATSSRKQS